MKVVVVLPVSSTHKHLLENSCKTGEFAYIPKMSVQKSDLEDAEVIIGDVPADLIWDSKTLKLLQLNSAGADQYLIPGAFPSQATLCNATGAYGLAISEHMLAALLAIQKRLWQYLDNQHESLWRDEGPVTSIWGSKTLVIGLGDIGSEFAKRMNALGSTVYGIRRTPSPAPSFVEAVYTAEKIDELLPEMDIVAMALPGTASTKNVLDAKRFSLMKRGSILINVGRGSAVNQDALLHALQDGTLFGASIDVTTPEPLPRDSPLWKQRNLLITPHVSGFFHLQETFERIVRIAAQNLKAYSEGMPLVNIVDFATGYRKK